ncbi:MAG: amidohydrolase/deacetylase family metallohydrolase, partial [Alphaproteobacteria bacterium]|nr:amidohydrolase/deacetylase family metallohydrolase [Alphaproteobacteria bacterium]
MSEKPDLVLQGGRVIDPAQGIDGVMDVAISGGKIAALGSELSGSENIDVSGRLVIPGMIDTHAHVFEHIGGPFG